MFTLEGFGTYGCGTPSRRAGAASPAKEKREKGEKRKKGKRGTLPQFLVRSASRTGTKDRHPIPGNSVTSWQIPPAP
jgi:hypothetical protein